MTLLQQRLIAEFVGVPLCDLPTHATVSREGRTRQDRIEVWRHGDRSAVRCRHLSTGVQSNLMTVAQYQNPVSDSRNFFKSMADIDERHTFGL